MSLENISFIRPLGKGSFGEVWEAVYFGSLCIIKKIEKKTAFDKELMVSRQIDGGCKFLLKLITSFYKEEENKIFLYLVYEHTPRSRDLYQSIISKEFTHFTEKQIINLMYDICEGLQYLHSIGFLHLDIKPENILIVEYEEGELTPVIIDYGFCISEGEEMNGFPGTPVYISPEVWQGTASEKSDIYSLSALFYFIVSNGIDIFPDHWDEKTMMKIATNSCVLIDFPLNKLSLLSYDILSEMILRGLNQKPSRRPTLKQILTILRTDAMSVVE